MRILLVSDLHAMSREIEKYEGAYPGRSGGILRVEDRTTINNQILAIEQALAEFENPIDLMLCLGDMTHQAKQLPLMAAWSDIHHVAGQLSIPNVLGIIGNHDILSRAGNLDEVEAITEFLQNISPSFPGADADFNTDYFATGVASQTFDDCLLIALNTCRTHGYGFTQELTAQVFEVGALTDAMIERVVRVARESDKVHIVLAMHHHPLPVTERDDDNDQMEKGTLLLEQLSTVRKNVLLLHGHKHYVRLQTHNSAPKPTIVFSSASLCAYPFISEETHFSNQFHIVEFDTTEFDTPRGKILSWDWSANRWVESTRGHMPAEVFFGSEPDLQSIADYLTNIQSTAFVEYDQLISDLPVLKYVRNDQIEQINEMLSGTGKSLISSSSRISGLLYEEEV